MCRQDYKVFLDFVLAMENKSTPQALHVRASLVLATISFLLLAPASCRPAFVVSPRFLSFMSLRLRYSPASQPLISSSHPD